MVTVTVMIGHATRGRSLHIFIFRVRDSVVTKMMYSPTRAKCVSRVLLLPSANAVLMMMLMLMMLMLLMTMFQPVHCQYCGWKMFVSNLGCDTGEEVF